MRVIVRVSVEMVRDTVVVLIPTAAVRHAIIALFLRRDGVVVVIGIEVILLLVIVRVERIRRITILIRVRLLLARVDAVVVVVRVEPVVFAVVVGVGRRIEGLPCSNFVSTVSLSSSSSR